MQNSLGNGNGILSTSEEPPQLITELPILACGQKSCDNCLIEIEYLRRKDIPGITVRNLRDGMGKALLSTPAPVIGKSSALATAAVAARLNDYNNRVTTCVRINGSAPIVEGFIYAAERKFESDNGPANH